MDNQGTPLNEQGEVRHKAERHYGGKNEMSWIQTECSCGWVGVKQYAYNDYQRTNLKDEWLKHLRQSR